MNWKWALGQLAADKEVRLTGWSDDCRLYMDDQGTIRWWGSDIEVKLTSFLLTATKWELYVEPELWQFRVGDTFEYDKHYSNGLRPNWEVAIVTKIEPDLYYGEKVWISKNDWNGSGSWREHGRNFKRAPGKLTVTEVPDTISIDMGNLLDAQCGLTERQRKQVEEIVDKRLKAVRGAVLRGMV